MSLSLQNIYLRQTTPLTYACISSEKIENLQCLTKLKYLNLSQNSISKIEELASLTCLETLIISENEISMTDFVKHITLIPKLRELDLSMNKINCNPESILGILADCKSLKVLSLQGNPFVNKMPHYRSMIISHCKKLRQLDGRRICSEERRRCNAWGEVILNGGTFDQANEADRQELNKIRLERSSKNAARRSSLVSQSSSCSSSDRSKGGSIGSSMLEGVKRTFGRTSSSEISQSSSWSRRNIDLEIDAEEAEEGQNCSMKKYKGDTSIGWHRISDNSPRGID